MNLSEQGPPDPRDWSPHAQATLEPQLSDMSRHDLVRELLVAQFQRDRLKHAMNEITRYADGPSYRIACDALREVSR